MDYTKLPIGAKAPNLVNAVFEVPLGQANKYEYDAKLQVFRLDRPLYTSVHYPCEYGFIPGILGEDGDARICWMKLNISSPCTNSLRKNGSKFPDDAAWPRQEA